MNRLTKAQTIEAQFFMAQLSREGFKPGSLKSKATQSFTKSLSAKCIRAIARRNSQPITVGNVESYDAAQQRSSDFLGTIDLLAVTPTLTRGIQACGTDVAEHLRKIDEGDRFRKLNIWLSSPCRTFEIWSWRQYQSYRKDGSKGKTKFWCPRIQLITPGYLLGHEPEIVLSLSELNEVIAKKERAIALALSGV